jgi:hypothetical protein
MRVHLIVVMVGLSMSGIHTVLSAEKATPHTTQQKKQTKKSHRRQERNRKKPTATTPVATQPSLDSKPPASSTSAQHKPQTRTLQLTNNVKNKELGYSKFFVTYQPTHFTISSKDVTIAPGKTMPIVATDDIVDLKYYCEFKNGYRKSCYCYRYKMAPNKHKGTITFKWKRDPRLVLEGATLLSQERIELS